jgi:DNA primase
MKYPKEYLEEIKLRLKVSQVVGQSVKLKKRGKEFIGLSPFSNEKSPSFTVNDEKGFYHCFSSAEHGNIFDFLMKTKNLKFGEAVRTLASNAGMEPYRFTPQDEEKQKRYNIYNSILEKYSNFCHKDLVSGKYSEVSQYLEKRKITKNEISFFNIGFSSMNNNFYNELKKEFSEEQISRSGIYYLDENKKTYVDRFRNRIIIPVNSLNNKTLALGGRAISKNSFAKYINSPETEFYKKGNNLYNINSAKNIRDEDAVYIVEGYMDVINLHKFGIKNVVANLGTALTERQTDMAWRFFKNITICLDGDSSGQKAALRAAERLFPLIKPEYNIYFLTLPENLDPDSYINQKGKDAFLNISKQKIEISDFIWENYYKDVDARSPQSLSLFEKKIKTICNEIKDKTLSKYFLENFIQRINDFTPNLTRRKNSFLNFEKFSRPLVQTREINQQRNKFGKEELKEFSLIYLMINNMKVFRKNIELISDVSFSSNLLEKLKQGIINYLLSEEFSETQNSIYEILDKEFKEILDTINKNAPVKSIAINKKEEEIVIMFSEIISELNRIELNKKIETLEDKVSANLDEKLYSELLSLRNQLKRG